MKFVVAILAVIAVVFLVLAIGALTLSFWLSAVMDTALAVACGVGAWFLRRRSLGQSQG